MLPPISGLTYHKKSLIDRDLRCYICSIHETEPIQVLEPLYIYVSNINSFKAIANLLDYKLVLLQIS